MSARFLLALLLLPVFGCATTPSIRGPWRELQTPSFTIRSNQNEADARETARQLEQTRRNLLASAWSNGSVPGKTSVVVFAHPDQSRDLLDGRHAGMTILGRGARSTIVLPAWTGPSPPETVAHELAHDLSSWFMPAQPVWLSEGFATYLETVQEDEKTRSAFMGAVPQAARWLPRANVDLKSREVLRAGSTEYKGWEQEGGFYARSWLLVHYLLSEQGTAFASFQRKLFHLEDWQDAWASEFPKLSPAVLDGEVAKYWRERSSWPLVSGVAPVGVHDTELTVRPLTDADVHGLFAYLALQRRSLDSAASEAERALALDPTQMEALEVVFQLCPPTTPEGRARRSEIARSSVNTHPTNGRAWLLLAEAAGGGEPALEALRQADRFTPNEPGIRRRLAKALIESNQASGALIHTRFALRRSRLTPELLLLHGIALAANNQFAEVRRLSNRTVSAMVHQLHFSRLDELAVAWLFALHRSDWREIDGGEPLFMAYDLAAALLERGRNADAAEVAKRAPNAPIALMGMRADSRFDTLIPRNAPEYGLGQALKRQLQTLTTSAARFPDSMRLQLDLIDALFNTQQFSEIIARTDGLLASADTVNYRDLDWYGGVGVVWQVRADALWALGRWDEALAAGKRSVAGVIGLSAFRTLRLATRYCAMNLPREALSTVARLDELDNHHATMRELVRYTAAIQLGDEGTARAALAVLKRAAETDPDLLQTALVRGPDQEAAARLLISRLADPALRRGALIWVQRGTDLPRPPTERAWFAHRHALLNRSDVRAAIDRVGRAEDTPVPDDL